MSSTNPLRNISAASHGSLAPAHSNNQQHTATPATPSTAPTAAQTHFSPTTPPSQQLQASTLSASSSFAVGVPASSAASGPEIGTFVAKVWVHESLTSDEDLIVNLEALPKGILGSVIEVRVKDKGVVSDQPLILQITEASAKNPLKGGQLSINRNLAEVFKIPNRCDCVVNVVHPETVKIELLELYVKDQNVSGSDMWRFKQQITDTCVYSQKKIFFSGARIQVQDIYAHGHKLRSGFVSENSKCVFRSLSARIFVVFQMSSEMWDFDIESGDILFEKAVNGFLADLISQWKENGCSHEVTILMVSRTYYSEKRLEEFPEVMHASVQRDEKDRFYEDFVRVVYSTPDSDMPSGEWNNVFGILRDQFMRYEDNVNATFSNSRPTGRISCAEESNTLESINLVLNSIEYEYMNHPFCTTAKSIITVSAGHGIFAVSRKLASLTRTRVTELCVGAEVVCISHLPLHCVPLLVIFEEKAESKAEPEWHRHNSKVSFSESLNEEVDKEADANTSDDTSFQIPNWLTAKFYDCKENFGRKESIRAGNAKKGMRPVVKEDYQCGFYNVASMNAKSWEYINNVNLAEAAEMNHTVSFEDAWEPVPVIESDYDLFDKYIFVEKRTEVKKVEKSEKEKSEKEKSEKEKSENEKSENEKPEKEAEASSSKSGKGLTPSVSPAVALSRSPNTQAAKGSEEKFGSCESKNNSIAAQSPDTRSCSLGSQTEGSEKQVSKSINIPKKAPLAQTHLGSTPKYMNNSLMASMSSLSSMGSDGEGGTSGNKVVKDGAKALKDGDSRRPSEVKGTKPKKVNPFRPHGGPNQSLVDPRWAHVYLSFYDDIHDNPAFSWRSLIEPACLPLTTHYMPSSKEFNAQFREFTYSLSVDDNINGPSMIEAILQELICQRLNKGFQLVLPPTSVDSLQIETSVRTKSPSTFAGSSVLSSPGSSAVSPSGSSANLSSLDIGILRSSTPSKGSALGITSRSSARQKHDPIANLLPLASPVKSDYSDFKKPYYLSLGSQYHKLFFDSDGRSIEVKRYVSKRSSVKDTYSYSFRLWPLHRKESETTSVQFFRTQSSPCNWNYLDQLICGNFTEFMDTLQAPRIRFVLMPLDAKSQSYRGSAETEKKEGRAKALEIESQCIANFEKFVDYLNRPRKPHQPSSNAPAKSSKSSSSKSTNAVGPSASSLNERLTTESDPSLIGRIIQRTIKDREHRLKMKSRSSFRASDFVDWAVKHVKSLRGNQNISRDEAVVLGQKMLDSRVFENEKSSGQISGRFRDERTLLRVKRTDSNLSHEMYERQKQKSQSPLSSPNRSPAMTRTALLKRNSGSFAELSIPSFEKEGTTFDIYVQASSKGDETPHGRGLNSSQEISVGEQEQLNTSRVTKMPVLNTKSAAIDLNCWSHQTNRKEWVVAHYDSVYSPQQAFHIELHWLVATGCLVDELLQIWSRKASQLHLSLIPVPTEPIFPTSKHGLQFNPNRNPFVSPVFIALAHASVEGTVVNTHSINSALSRQMKLLRNHMLRFSGSPHSISRTELTNSRDTVSELTIDTLDNGFDSNYDTFQSVVDGPVFDVALQIALLEKFDFVLDSEADDISAKSSSLFPTAGTSSYSKQFRFNYPQYIHRTGIAFVHLVNDMDSGSRDKRRGFYFSPNPVLYFMGKTRGESVPQNAFTQLFKSFKSFCSDEHKLLNFWNEKVMKEKNEESFSSSNNTSVNETSEVSDNLNKSGRHRTLKSIVREMSKQKPFDLSTSENPDKIDEAQNQPIESRNPREKVAEGGQGPSEHLQGDHGKPRQRIGRFSISEKPDSCSTVASQESLQQDVNPPSVAGEPSVNKATSEQSKLEGNSPETQTQEVSQTLPLPQSPKKSEESQRQLSGDDDDT
eukprot:Nk52_evm68s485 gene=Nk52_evmTU68s485